jgi:serine/threonine-protein kinase
MKEEWSWVGRYLAVVLSAVVLAAVLGGMNLFETTTVMNGRLSAAHIVKFLGFGGALVVCWLFAQRATVLLARQGGRWGFLQHLLLPVASLIVVASAHRVLLLILRPVMDSGVRNAYDWVFIVAIIAAAGWVVSALFHQSSSLTQALSSAAQSFASANPGRNCPQCGAAVAGSARFCPQCGKAMA